MALYDEDLGWRCAVPFDSDHPEFRRGVEIGTLWERLNWEDRAEATMHADCAEMVIRIAEAKGLPFTADPLGDNWLAVRIGKWESG